MSEQRLIDANALKTELCLKGELSARAFKVMVRTVDSAPTIDAEPVKHGKWIDEGFIYARKCSKCSYPYGCVSYEYCPHCGARMDGDS